MNREIESMAMRPLAKDLTRSLEEVRNITRDQALRDLNNYTDRMREALRQFDSLFAEFELRYDHLKKKKFKCDKHCNKHCNITLFCAFPAAMCQPWCL